MVEVRTRIALLIHLARANIARIGRTKNLDELCLIALFACRGEFLFVRSRVLNLPQVLRGTLRTIEHLRGIPEGLFRPRGDLLEVGGGSLGNTCRGNIKRHGGVREPKRIHPRVESIERILDGRN